MPLNSRIKRAKRIGKIRINETTGEVMAGYFQDENGKWYKTNKGE